MIEQVDQRNDNEGAPTSHAYFILNFLVAFIERLFSWSWIFWIWTSRHLSIL